jgi:hypothetical protein
MSEPPRARSLATWLTIVAIVVLCLPALVLAYLPMTDLPQHLAIASILNNVDDPAFGFASYYTVDWWHTPYVLPYAIAVALAMVMPLAIAMKIVVFLSLVAYPLGVMALLRAARKPLWFALLALPLVYNRSVFWGFINFSMAIGLALAAFACFIEPRKSWRRDCVQAMLTLAATFCHVYGLAMIAGLVVAYVVVGGGHRDVRARPWIVAPIVAGAAVWLWKATEAHGFGVYASPPFTQRIGDLPSSILGGYSDRSELVILVLFVVACGALAWPTMTRNRFRELAPAERVACIAIAGNLLAYFVLPEQTWTAKFVHFRHAFLACCMLPLLASADSLQRIPLVKRALPALAAAGALANAWVHLVLFDRDARGFDRIVAALPPAPKVVSLIFDRNGALVVTNPYLHFPGYVQAEHGGLISTTFPALFWNLPVELRPDARVPETPLNFEWIPHRYTESFGHFYDWALVRRQREPIEQGTARFPFVLVEQAPPWYLYKRVAVTTTPTTP